MRRSALIFLAAILLPSLGLAWMAIHSVRDQQVVLEHQQAIISQGMTDALAASIQDQMNHIRDDFTQTTRDLLAQSDSPQALAPTFNAKIHQAWPMAEVGFAVDLNGNIYSPKSFEGTNAKTFRTDNDRFLSNRENVEVYSQNATVGNNNSYNFGSNSYHATGGISANSPQSLGGAIIQNLESNRLKEAPQAPQQTEINSKDEQQKQLEPSVPSDKKTKPANESARATAFAPAAAASMPSAPLPDNLVPTTKAITQPTTPPSAPAAIPASDSTAANATATAPVPAAAPAVMPILPQASAGESRAFDAASDYDQIKNTQNIAKIQRKVMPQQILTRDTATLSNTVPEESDFRRVTGTETSGTLARFLENNLRLMVWTHPAEASSIVFGAQLDQSRLVETLKAAFPVPSNPDRSYMGSAEPATCLAILDDNGKPVALSIPNFTADWKHPFVATELGEALPHWEAALYLVDPQQIGRSARTLRLTLGLIVLLLVAAIVAGGSLIAADVRRQVRLAQQKTDFVSNVSHELKTPLTSIRMFADLLAEKRVPDEAKQATYLRIIAAEAARLTRLINNVLDFARMERGAPDGERRACDLVEAARDVIETCAPHLEANGITFQHEIEAETLPLNGDRDALSQIILNLVSNAEKYGGKDILVRVRRQETSAGLLGCVDVLDRGPGIPAQQVATIFEPFHRLDDSLASGIPGSGLGLTLARRMARAHHGDVTYSSRAGGGSCFTLSIPLTRT